MLGWNSLDKGEKIDISLLYGSAIILGVGSILFRTQTVGALDLDLVQIQYGIAFLFLGSLLLLRARVRTASGIFMTTGLGVVLAIGLLLPAEGIELLEVASYALLGAMVVVGGLLHYRLNNPTNLHALGFAGLLGLEMYLFGLVYSVQSYRDSSDYWFLAAIVVFTVMFIVYLRVLRREYDESYSNFF